MKRSLSDVISRNWDKVELTRGSHFRWEGLFSHGYNFLDEENKQILLLEDMGESYTGRDF